MNVDELPRLASLGKRPDQAEPHDLLAWYELRELYREYKAGRISKERGEREKVRIIFDRQKYADRIAEVEQDVQRRAAFWKEIQNYATKYNLNPTVENADRFVKAVYGAGRIQQTL